MLQTPLKTLTLEKFLALPETKPTNEYIQGQVSQKPMPQGKHRQQILVFDLPNQQILMTSFAKELNLTVENIFMWLLA